MRLHAFFHPHEIQSHLTKEFMDPIQIHPGHYWLTNDAANLSFNEAGPERPTHIKCLNTHDHLNRGESRLVAVDSLTLLAKAHFQPGYFSWTGASYRYGIYEYKEELRGTSIVILVSHGGGMEGYILDGLTAVATWRKLIDILPEQYLWNSCYERVDMYKTARAAEASMWRTAAADNRLRVDRKRKRGHAFVSIEPKISSCHPVKPGSTEQYERSL